MNALVIGYRAQGKSTLALALARVHHPNVVIWDPRAQYAGGVVIHRASDLKLWLEDDDRMDILIFQPEIGSDKPGKSEQFSELVAIIREGHWGNFSIIVDEAHELQRPQGINPELDWLMRQAPREGPAEITVIQTCHALVDYHPTVHRLISDAFIFNSRYARDLPRIEEHYGASVAAVSSRLKRYEVVHCFDSDTEDGDLRRAYCVWRSAESGSWYLPLDGTGRSSSRQR